jgi:RNA 2',3'-cyclic 3'-phosphodiesterase
VSRGATARLFVAVDPPTDVCSELAAWARAALGGLRALDRRQRERERAGGGDVGAGAGANVRLLGTETMHVTLCFLGARPASEIETIAAAVEGCPAERLELHVGAPLWLPPRRPRSLALSIHDRASELERLHASVCDALAEAIDWQPDRRRYRAHVTVARLGREARRGHSARGRRGHADSVESRAGVERSAGRETRAGRESPLPPSPQLSFMPRALVLYRSLLSPAGASYEEIATRTLERSPSAPTPSLSPEAAPATGGELETTRHASIEPSSASVGREPSSHSGAEPSSQE